MRALPTIACLSMACAGEPPPEPIVPAKVHLPAWATTPSASVAPVAKTNAPVSLGSADHPTKFTSAKKIDLDVVAADLPNVCRLIGDLAGVNIVVSDEITGTVTVKMKNVAWDEALDAILLSKGYRAERRGNVIVVRK